MTNSYEVNEGSSARVRIDFFDFDGNPDTPQSVTYEVHNLDSPVAVLREATAATPAQQVQIILTAQDTAIVSPRNGLAKERHGLVVRASFGGGDDLNEIIEFYVINLPAVGAT